VGFFNTTREVTHDPSFEVEYPDGIGLS